MDQKRLNELVSALTAKGVNLSCPRCGENKFTVIGETNIPIQEDPSILRIGGPSIPTVIVACGSCGFIMQHATMVVLAPVNEGK